MCRKTIIAAILTFISTVCGATEVGNNIKQFNIMCPAKKLGPIIDNFYHECHSGMIRNEYNSCEKFISTFKELMPEYDCARNMDLSGTRKYNVPAIWLLGDGQFSDYHTLIHDMVFNKKYSIIEYAKARKDATALFFSSEFKKVLDASGEIYEDEWEAHDKKKNE